LAFAHGSDQRAGAGLPEVQAREPVEPPPDLSPDERAVWDELAPLAIQLRTLAPATRRSFVDLCRARVNRDMCRDTLAAEGWTVLVDGEPKKHPLAIELRGWELRVEAAMARFGLAPIGKPVVAAADRPSEDERFERFLTG
jgi:hypothetical protein